MVGAALLEAFLGAILIVLGRWGQSTAPRLVPRTFDAHDGAARERAYRRGASACIAVGAALVLISFAALVAK